MRRTLIITVALISMFAGITGWVFAYVIVPPSLRFNMASIAMCGLNDKDLRNENDQYFKGIKFWELPLAHIYRFSTLHLGGQFVFDDMLIGKSSALHATFIAATTYPSKCDNSIYQYFLSLIKHGAPVNVYNQHGTTVMHEAIIYGKPKYVRLLHDSGANVNLKYNDDAFKELYGLDSLQLAKLLYKKTKNKQYREAQYEIIKILESKT